MTNPGRDVSLVAGDRTYTLYTGNRALRLMERETGEGLFSIVERFDSIERIEIGLLTTILWACMARHHPDLSLDDIDDVIDAAGYEAVTAAIGTAIERAFPQASADGSVASGKAPSGTGMRSQSGRLRPA